MSCPTLREPYERLGRIRRALHLRRRSRAQRAGMVVASVAALAVSVFAAWSMIRAFDPTTPVERLQITDVQADSASAATADTHVWLEVGPPVADPAAATDASAASAPPVTESPAITPIADGPTTTFNGRTVKPIGTMRMLVTAYCPCRRCCGRHANGRTAAGYSVWTNRGKLVAADTRLLPFGSLVSVPGYDHDRPVPVLDRGGRIKGHRLDVLYPTHRAAKKWGARWLDVTVYDYVD